MRTKHYWLPDIGETVLCAFLGNGMETGFILGSSYSDVDGVPVGDVSKKGIWFEDGTFIQYDVSEKILTIKNTNPITVIGDVDITGNMNISGNLSVGGTVSAPLFVGTFSGSVVP